MLIEKVEKILAYAPTTEVFRAYALTLFWNGYNFGVDRTRPNNIAWLLDIGKTESGIFDIERARELEREAYNIHVQGYLSGPKTLEEIIARGLTHETPIPAPYSEYYSILGKWRQEFTDRYGNEP